jgi:hypothetical protein
MKNFVPSPRLTVWYRKAKLSILSAHHTFHKSTEIHRYWSNLKENLIEFIKHLIPYPRLTVWYRKAKLSILSTYFTLHKSAEIHRYLSIFKETLLISWNIYFPLPAYPFHTGRRDLVFWVRMTRYITGQRFIDINPFLRKLYSSSWKI